MKKRNFYAMLLASALCMPLLAACGGSDDGPDPDDPVLDPGQPDEPGQPDSPAADGVITKILCYEIDESGEFLGEEYYFSYDKEDRLTDIRFVNHDEMVSGGPYEKRRRTNAMRTRTVIDSEGTCKITYSKGVITYLLTMMDGDQPDYKMESTAYLDEHGRIVSGTRTETEYSHDDSSYVEDITVQSYKLSYDAAGYLVRSVLVEGEEESEEKLHWEDGNLMAVSWDYGMGIVNDTALYGDVLNRPNLDLNWMIAYMEAEGFAFAAGDEQRILAVAGYVGKRCRALAREVCEARDSYYGQYTFSYKVNEKGLPVSITKAEKETDFTGSGITYRYDITY